MIDEADGQHKTYRLKRAGTILLFFVLKGLLVVMYIIPDKSKELIRQRIIIGALNYKKYLMNKVFLIICHDGSCYNVRFLLKDYAHLTGVRTDLTPKDFFNNCINRKISIKNIISQKYNWNTLKKKTSKINELYQIMYSEGNKTLLLESAQSHTKIFPIAIHNASTNSCIAFNSHKNTNNARSLRIEKNPMPALQQKNIIAIYSKGINYTKYSEQVYISNVKNLFSVFPTINQILDYKILEKYDFILENNSDSH